METVNKTASTKQRVLKWLLIGGLSMAILVLAGPVFVLVSTKQHFSSENELNRLGSKEVAVVFGAGVNPDRKPTPFLQARLETAVELYRAGKVKKVLVSGDNRAANYNEPFVMREEVIALGVPEADVVADFAGLDTYDSCYRAKHIFKIDSAFVVSQGYHIPRAVLTCRKLGIDAVGVSTSRYWNVYRRLVYPNYIFREVFSINKSLVELYVTKPSAAILGEPEPLN